jgi:hypothetical protein
MQLSSFLPLVLTFLPALVAGDACVAGGPAAQVTEVKECCLYNGGTWYQFYDVQAICVLATTQVKWYDECVSYIPNSLLDTKCIPGSGAGLSSGLTATATVTPQVTFTARAF